MSQRTVRFWSFLAALILAAGVTACSSSGPDSDWAGEDSFFGEEDMAIVDGDDFEDFGDFADADFDDFEDFGDFSEFDDVAMNDGDFSDFDDFDFDDFDDFENFDAGESLAQELGGGEDDFFFEDGFDDASEDAFASADPLSDDAFAEDPFGGDVFAGESFSGDGFAEDPFGEEIASADLPEAPLASVDEFLEPAADNFVPLEEDLGPGFADYNAQMGLVPVRKVEEMPRYRNGVMLNAVYIARPGDTVASISQRIFGEDRSSEIVAHNPWLSDGIKVGEKLYYNSPNRPSDNTAMLVYFEDVGTPAQSYVTGGSENIRHLASDLLGFNDAWKEVWATNLHVDSKDALPAGTELRYWTETAPAAPALAQAPPAPASPPGDLLGLSGLDVNQPNLASSPSSDLPPPPQPVASDFDSFPESAPPSDFSDPIAAQAPAPMPVEELNLPPPPPAPSATQSYSQSSSGGGSTDMLTMAAVVGVVVVLLLLLVSMARKRRPVSMEYTQV